jgi:hypothetical protein
MTSEDNKLSYVYYQGRDSKQQVAVISCLLVDASSELVVARGLAIRSPRDAPNDKLGKAIARGRAEKAYRKGQGSSLSQYWGATNRIEIQGTFLSCQSFWSHKMAYLPTVLQSGERSALEKFMTNFRKKRTQNDGTIKAIYLKIVDGIKIAYLLYGPEPSEQALAIAQDGALGFFSSFSELRRAHPDWRHDHRIWDETGRFV